MLSIIPPLNQARYASTAILVLNDSTAALVLRPVVRCIAKCLVQAGSSLSPLQSPIDVHAV